MFFELFFYLSFAIAIFTILHMFICLDTSFFKKIVFALLIYSFSIVGVLIYWFYYFGKRRERLRKETCPHCKSLHTKFIYRQERKIPKQINVCDDESVNIEYEYEVEYCRECLDCKGTYSYVEIEDEKQVKKNRRKFKIS